MDMPLRRLPVLLLLLLPFGHALADRYEDTIKAFRAAGESARFFDRS